MGQRLGQHFLTRPEIAGWVADAAALSPDSTVLEIGPGHGILTRELLKRAGKVVAVEKDTALITELHTTFARELDSGQLTLIELDIRDFDPGAHSSLLTPHFSLVSNIPYYITGLIIRTFLTTKHQPTCMALLVQKEVAERIVAKDGKESILSLSVKAYGAPTYVRTVKAGSFSPAPKVDSAILAIHDISRARFATSEAEDHFFTLIKSGFSSKRKIVSSNLKDMATPEMMHACAIPDRSRAETVTLEQWCCLANTGQSRNTTL